jgi:hypothetical protein
MMEENIKDMQLGPEPFVDANTAGTYLKLHPVTVQRFARNGSLPAHPLQKASRKYWRFLLSELGDWPKGRTGE